MVQYEILVSTLIAGLIIGYLAQRARMCFIGGTRDFVLVKDTHLIKAPLFFFIGAAAVFSVSYLFTSVPKWPWFVTGGFAPYCWRTLINCDYRSNLGSCPFSCNRWSRLRFVFCFCRRLPTKTTCDGFRRR